MRFSRSTHLLMFLSVEPLTLIIRTVLAILVELIDLVNSVTQMVRSFEIENHHSVILLSVVSKVFEKHVNNRIVDHLEKRGLFSDFHYGFMSSRSTADLLTVVSDRIARAFNRSGATRVVALDISKAFDSVWYAGLLHKLKSYRISGQIFGLISSFLSNGWL